MAITYFRCDPNIDDLEMKPTPPARGDKRSFSRLVKSGDNGTAMLPR